MSMDKDQQDDGWRGTGEEQRVETKRGLELDRLPEFDGNHYWVVLMLHACAPETWSATKQPRFDNESLKLVNGPVCYWCGSAWHPLVVANPLCVGPQEEDE